MFFRISRRPINASVLELPPATAHLGQFIKLTSSRVVLFLGSAPRAGDWEKTKPKFRQKSNPKGQPDPNLLTHTHQILPRVIVFVEIWLYKSYAGSSSVSIIDKTPVFTLGDVYWSRLKNGMTDCSFFHEKNICK